MGIWDWVAGNYEKIEAGKARGRAQGMASLMAENAPQAEALQGYNTMQTGQDGLTTGMSGGLMADPTNPMNVLQMGTGLMAIPGYQEAGQQIMGKAISESLGRPYQQAQLQQQALYQQQQLQLQQIQAQRAQQQQGFDRAQKLAGRADKVLMPIRDALSMYNTTQNMIINTGGFSEMSGADDEALIKAYAKMVLPKEAVMTDDAGRIVMSDNFDSFIRGLKEKFNVKGQLSWQERKSIFDSMTRQAQGKMAEYSAGRQDFERFAQNAMVNPADVLREAIRTDFGMDVPIGGGAQVPEQISNELDTKARQQDPNVFDQLGDWWRN